MASDEWLRRSESEGRAARNAQREQQRAREEHLLSLTDEERTTYLSEEQEVEQARQRVAEEASRHRDEENRRERHEAADTYKRDRLLLVLRVWQSLRGHKLSPERCEKFLAHPDAATLGAFDRETLDVAGRRAMAANDGDLLLTQWLEEARERDRKQRARAEIPDWKRNLPPG